MIPPAATPSPTAPPPAVAPLREAALRLEAAFLKEMLSAAGLGRPPGLGGGAGEAQFASFLLDAQALAMARAGGVGLAQSIVEALARQGTPAGPPPGGPAQPPRQPPTEASHAG